MEILVFAVAALWVVVLLQIGATYALARQMGVLFERVTPVGAMISNAGPEIGAAAPRIALANLNGPDLTLGEAGGRGQLVFFLSPSCPVCKALVPALRGVRRAEAGWLDVVLASDGPEPAHRALIAEAGLEPFAYALSSELGMAFRVAKLPFAVLIDGAGTIRAKGLVNSREQLESLFAALETGHPSVQSLAARPADPAAQPV